MTERREQGGHPRALEAPPNRAQLLLYQGLTFFLRGFARLWFRLRVEGAEKVPATGSFILAPIHRSNIDFLVILGVTKRQMRYLAKDSLWKPGWGTLFTALGGIPVTRGSADRDALRTCIAVVERGEALVMFPEGTRQSGPEISELFDGPSFVQARTGVPIVPVGIGGSEAAMPKGAKFLKPRKIVVLVGDPILALESEGPKARRSAVKQQTAALGVEVQALFDEAQRQAGTPNRRSIR